MKKIFLIPNLFTLCNLMCGYWSITFALKGNFMQASVMIFLSIIFDAFDGRVARITRTTSKFGLEFDSIADVVSFGLAPAAIIYQLLASDADAEKFAWWGGFIYAACGALRLARYNIQSSSEEKEDFTGLPIPCAAGMVASFVLFNLKYDFAFNFYMIIFIVIPVALLMVSTIRYSSFQINFQNRKPLEYFVAAVVLISLLVRFPHQVLLFVFSCYILFGLFQSVRHKIFKTASIQLETKN